MFAEALGFVVEKVDQALLAILRFLREYGFADAAVIVDHADRNRGIIGRRLTERGERIAEQAVEILPRQFEARAIAGDGHQPRVDPIPGVARNHFGQRIGRRQGGVEIVDGGGERTGRDFDEEADLEHRALAVAAERADGNILGQRLRLVERVLQRGDGFAFQYVLAGRDADADRAGMILQCPVQIVEIDPFDIARQGRGNQLREWAGERLRPLHRDRGRAGILAEAVDRLVDEHGPPEIVQRHRQHGEIDRQQDEHDDDRAQRRVAQLGFGIDRRQRQHGKQRGEGQAGDRDLDEALAQPAIDQPHAEIACRQREHQQRDREEQGQQRGIDTGDDPCGLLRGIGGGDGREIAVEDPIGQPVAIGIEHRSESERRGDDGPQSEEPVTRHEAVHDPSDQPDNRIAPPHRDAHRSSPFFHANTGT